MKNPLHGAATVREYNEVMELKKEEIDANGKIISLTLSGKIKSGYLDELERELNKLEKYKSVKLLLDLLAVNTIDSSAIGMFIEARNEIIQSGGNVVLVVRGSVEKIIKLSGLDHYFQIASTHEEAIELLNQLQPQQVAPLDDKDYDATGENP